jgi:hypothetical protein
MRADIIAVTDKGDPYRSLVEAELPDIRLVIRSGVPVYAGGSCVGLFDRLTSRSHACVIGDERRSACDIGGLLARIRKAVGYPKELPFLPVG